MKKEYMIIIKAVDKILNKGEEPDTAMIAKESGTFTSQQVYDFITEMEEEGFLIAFEIDMCCGEDYIVKELTEKGKALL